MTTMQGTQWNDYHSIASLDSYHAPIEFVIPLHTGFTLIRLKPICISNSESYSKQVKILKRVQQYFNLTFFSQYVPWHRFVY